MWIPQCLKNALSGHCCLSVEDIEMTTFNNGAKSTDLLVTRIAVAGSCNTSQQPSPALLAMSYDSMVPSAPVQPVRSPRSSPSHSSTTPVARASDRKKKRPRSFNMSLLFFVSSFEINLKLATQNIRCLSALIKYRRSSPPNAMGPPSPFQLIIRILGIYPSCS